MNKFNEIKIITIYSFTTTLGSPFVIEHHDKGDTYINKENSEFKLFRCIIEITPNTSKVNFNLLMSEK